MFLIDITLFQPKRAVKGFYRVSSWAVHFYERDGAGMAIRPELAVLTCWNGPYGSKRPNVVGSRIKEDE